MNFELEQGIAILENTPAVMRKLIGSLSETWTSKNEGPKSWSPYDIIGHLIHGEKTDWMSRMDIILDGNENQVFEPFDRFAQFENSKGKSLEDLLEEFSSLRQINLTKLRSKELSEKELLMESIHPDLGRVILKELLASWVVHDLNHIAQTCRVMAYQYSQEVGPWKNYMGILKR
jgi:hypothetical protein